MKLSIEAQLSTLYINLMTQSLHPQPRSYVLVLDLADGGALFDRVVEEGKLSEKEASSYLLQVPPTQPPSPFARVADERGWGAESGRMQVLEAILHMHRRKICHGDIKPENLLLTSDDPNASIKICDFGMARFIETGQSIVLNQNTGTMDYWWSRTLDPPALLKIGEVSIKSSALLTLRVRH